MKKKPIKEIETLLEKVESYQDPLLQILRSDDRKGVMILLERWKKKHEQKLLLHNQFKEMSKYETELYGKGYQYIAGIDEVGRGPLAGPVVAAAVILPADFYLPGLTDSKKLTPSKRALFNEYIKKHAISYGIGIIDSKKIDEVNIYEATKIAMGCAIENLKVEAEYLLIDAMKLETTIPQRALVKGDAKSISIAASSVIAKEARDHYMIELASKYPGYGFETNMGYGTKEHLLALEVKGATEEHRQSFTPVKELIVS